MGRRLVGGRSRDGEGAFQAGARGESDDDATAEAAADVEQALASVGAAVRQARELRVTVRVVTVYMVIRCFASSRSPVL